MMKNSKLGRILVLLACAVLLVSLSVGATLAYLTSTTQTVENTFTVGKVNITLDEVEVDKNGKIVYEDDKVTEKRTKNGNTDVHLLPGRNIPKDPTVTVLAGSEDCYVRVKVTVDVYEGYKRPADDGTNGTTSWDDEFREWAEHFAKAYIRNNGNQGFDTNYWAEVATYVDADESTITYILTYTEKKSDGTENAIVAKNENGNTELPAVFTHVEVTPYQDNADLAKLAGMKINVVAEAIQADGFEDATAAWTAFEDQKVFEEQLQNPGNQEGSENQN